MQIGVRAINRCANSSAAAAAVNKRTMLARSPTARSEVKSERREGENNRRTRTRTRTDAMSDAKKPNESSEAAGINEGSRSIGGGGGDDDDESGVVGLLLSIDEGGVAPFRLTMIGRCAHARSGSCL